MFCFWLFLLFYFILFLFIFILFLFIFLFIYLFIFFWGGGGGGGGGGVPKNRKTCICIMDMHNLQQLWISIIALWVICLLDYGYEYVQLWQSIMATHDTIMDIHKDNSNLDIKTFNIMDIYNSVMDIHNDRVYSHFPYHHHYHRHYQRHHHHHHHHHHLTIDSWHITVEYNTILNTKMWSDMNSQKDTHIPRT